MHLPVPVLQRRAAAGRHRARASQQLSQNGLLAIARARVPERDRGLDVGRWWQWLLVVALIGPIPRQQVGLVRVDRLALGADELVDALEVIGRVGGGGRGCVEAREGLVDAAVDEARLEAVGRLRGGGLRGVAGLGGVGGGRVAAEAGCVGGLVVVAGTHVDELGVAAGGGGHGFVLRGLISSLGFVSKAREGGWV